MPDLDFRVEGAAAVPYAAVPLLGLRLRAVESLLARAEADA
jgi:hypothetical protein